MLGVGMDGGAPLGLSKRGAAGKHEAGKPAP